MPPSKNIAVGMVDPTGARGGTQYYDNALCKALIAEHCDVSYFTSDETPDPGIPGLDFQSTYRGVFGDRNRWLRLIAYITSTLRTVIRAKKRGLRICHFHVYNAPAAESIVISLSLLSGQKLVLAVHDVECLSGPAARRRKVSALLYNKAHALIAHNQIARAELLNIGIPASNIHVIRHGHYLDSVRTKPPKAEARQQLGIGNTEKVVLFFGQIKDVKGLDVLIESVAEASKQIPELTLVVAGRPWRTDFSKYQTLIDSKGLGQRTRLFIRYIAEEEVARFYAAADLVVLPYRKIYQSGVLMMAMSYGTPVVVSDLPGLTEVVRDGETGWVFRTESSDSLRDVLVEAFKSEAKRASVAENALQYIRAHHCWTEIAKQTVIVYRSVLK